MQIKESGEMYLITIYLLSISKEYVKSVDVAKKLEYSKPSVSRAIKILSKGGYIKLNDRKHIFLTKKGEKIAKEIYAKHISIKKLLLQLGVKEETAEKDACSIEHVLSNESYNKINEYIEKVK